MYKEYQVNEVFEKCTFAVFLPEERAPRQLTWQQKIARALRIRNIYFRECLGEFLGTLVLVVRIV